MSDGENIRIFEGVISVYDLNKGGALAGCLTADQKKSKEETEGGKAFLIIKEREDVSRTFLRLRG
jgi:hypothetical protein